MEKRERFTPRVYFQGDPQRAAENQGAYNTISRLTGEEDVSRTKQEFYEDSLISTILAAHTRTGMLPVNQITGKFLDLSTLPTFQESQNQIADVTSAFNAMPAEFREDFDNDPSKFVDWVQEAEPDELAELGLIPKADDQVEPAPEAPQDPPREPEPVDPVPEPPNEPALPMDVPKSR